MSRNSLITRILAAVVLTISLSSCKSGPPSLDEVKLPPVPVKFEAVKVHGISETIDTVGELKADQETLVSAEEAGQIEAILVNEGQYVSQGQPLIKIKANDVRADLDLALRDYERYKKLEQEGAVSTRELDEVSSRLLKLQANLDNREIQALFDGTIGEIYVDLGDFVAKGDPLLDLVKNFPLRVTYSVPEKVIPFVKLGTQIELTTESFPDKVFYASVDFISPRVDPDTRSLLLRAKLQNYNAYSVLKANQFVKISHPINAAKKALAIREESIALDQGLQFVYVAIPKEVEEGTQYIADKREVKTGTRKDGLVEIVSGIEDGELVIYAGLQRIFPGAVLENVAE